MADMWTCPECGRSFGRTSQGHECSPAMTAADYFATAHEREQPIFDAVHTHLDGLGPLHVEFLSVGIFFKNGPRIAELRTMTKWIALAFQLPTKLTSARLSRQVIGNGSRWYHVVNIHDASEIDEQILDWLTQAYLAA